MNKKIYLMKEKTTAPVFMEYFTFSGKPAEVKYRLHFP